MHEGISPTEKAFPSSCLARSVVATHNNYIHLYPLKGHTILHNLHRMFLNGESVTFIPCSENSDNCSHNDNQNDNHYNKCNNYTSYCGYCYGCLCCRLHIFCRLHTCGIGGIGKYGISVVDLDKQVIKLIKYRNNKLAQVKTQKQGILWLHGNWQIWSYLP